MLSRRAQLMVAGACASLFVVAGCASTTDSADGPVKAGGSDPLALSVVAQPNDQGQTLFTTIANAKKSVDIVVYTIGDSTSTTGADPALTTALVTALKNNVAVRLVLDGYNAGNHNNNLLGAQTIYRAAVAAGVPSPNLKANFSSVNFNITHQKTVIVDASAGSGGSPNLLISTGNFSDYKNAPFWKSRDFYVTTANQSLINQVENVFNSDFNCDGRTVINNLSSGAPLVWSNGTTGLNKGDAQGEYPLLAPTTAQPNFGYFDFGAQNYPNSSPVHSQVQGNSMAVQRALIQGAEKGAVMRIYNEEQKSAEIQADLLAAIARGVDVRLVETFEVGQKVTALQQLAAAGATVNMMAPDSVAGSTYIHAKMITVQPADGSTATGYVGSINFSDPSMNDNRELGIALGPADSAVITSMNGTFDHDYQVPLPVGFMMNKANGGNGYPTSWIAAAAKSGPDLDAPKQPEPPPPATRNSTAYPPPTPNFSTCGAMALSSAAAKK